MQLNPGETNVSSGACWMSTRRHLQLMVFLECIEVSVCPLWASPYTGVSTLASMTL
uniref:ADP,ATP carrier protein n=1 Tax=Arundo donax TaxID=35708 RepID=A0A0A9GX27_ARUDO